MAEIKDYSADQLHLNALSRSQDDYDTKNAIANQSLQNAVTFQNLCNLQSLQVLQANNVNSTELSKVMNKQSGDNDDTTKLFETLQGNKVSNNETQLNALRKQISAIVAAEIGKAAEQILAKISEKQS